VVPRAPATPPPPPQRSSSSPGFARVTTQPPISSATAQLEQRLGAAQIELRKLGSERHTLRSRLRREADRCRELESALRAEKELRGHASDEHAAALTGLKQRLSEVEAARDADAARHGADVAQRDVQLARLGAELEQSRQALASAEARPAAEATSAASRAAKVVAGLRRIRGIGPGYQRLLEQAGVTRVQQVAAWSPADVQSFAEKLRIKPERIQKDDWIGQARALDPDPED
jgi:predicted flap endonuclease-1-like 5' DNA nuclease